MLNFFINRKKIMSEKRVYKGLVLTDYAHAPYASWVKKGKKTIETRTRMFSHRGDVVICCGKKNSATPVAGLALCIVDMWDAAKMLEEHVDAAKIATSPGLIAYPLRNWRWFSREFPFAPQKIGGDFRGVFDLWIPDDVEIISKPEILPLYDWTPAKAEGDS
jgi:hypothetical protein